MVQPSASTVMTLAVLVSVDHGFAHALQGQWLVEHQTPWIRSAFDPDGVSRPPPRRSRRVRCCNAPPVTDDERCRGKGTHGQQNDAEASRDHFAFTHVITRAATSNRKNATMKYDAAPG